MQEKVRVYWNVREQAFSVQEYFNGSWRVGYYVDNPAILLRDVIFVVQPGGRARVLRDHRKNVHAYAQGYRIDDMLSQEYQSTVRNSSIDAAEVSYDPYVCETFIDENDQPIFNASWAWFRRDNKTYRPKVMAIV